MFTRDKQNQTNVLSIRWCLTLELLQERGAVRQGLSLAFCQSFGVFLCQILLETRQELKKLLSYFRMPTFCVLQLSSFFQVNRSKHAMFQAGISLGSYLPRMVKALVLASKIHKQLSCLPCFFSFLNANQVWRDSLECHGICNTLLPSRRN